MKKLALAVSICIAAVFTVTAQTATKPAPKSPLVTVTTKLAGVTYSQPQKKGRVIFGGLIPYGKIWRTGANGSTNITFNENVIFGGTPVSKGTYAIFTIPEEKEWTIMLNAQANTKGFEYDETKNVVSVKAPVTKTKKLAEAFTIVPPGKKLSFIWDNVMVSVPVKKQ